MGEKRTKKPDECSKAAAVAAAARLLAGLLACRSQATGPQLYSQDKSKVIKSREKYDRRFRHVRQYGIPDPSRAHGQLDPIELQALNLPARSSLFILKKAGFAGRVGARGQVARRAS